MSNIPYPKLKAFTAAVFLAFLLTSCSKLQLSAIPASPDGTYNTGQVVWHDLLTDDIESSKNFYGKLLGWHFEQHGQYILILNNGTPIGGMVKVNPDGKIRKSGGWITYFSIPDIDLTADWIEKSGGKTLKGPGEMINRGRFVTFTDPSGAPLVAINLKSGDPLTEVAQTGDWLWNELWSSDVERAVEFYQYLAGYTAQRVQGEGALEYWVLRDEEDKLRAGITEIPFKNLPDQWVPVVRIKEPLDAVQKVSSLGGEVIIHPDHPLSDGSVALIKDPTGGILMVESWDTKTKQKQEQAP